MTHAVASGGARFRGHGGGVPCGSAADPFQSLLDRPLDGGEDGVVHLLTDLYFDIVREASAIYDLHIAIKVASVMELLGMAHRDIPP